MRLGKWLVRICSVGLIASSMHFGVASAATDNNAGFIAAYEHNAQIEVTLTTQQLNSSLVSKLNSQVSALYQMEVQMDAMVEGGVQPGAAALSVKLLQELTSVTTTVSTLQQSIQTTKKGSKDDANNQSLRAVSEDLWMIRGNLKQLSGGLSNTTASFSANNVYFLQKIIFAMQHEMIDLTSYLVNVASPTSSPAKAANISGISYDMVNVTPATQTIRDMVIALPLVTDANSNIISAAGTYSLTGPKGAQGVSISSASGLISIKPNASLGDYFVVYSNSGAYETITIHIL